MSTKYIRALVSPNAVGTLNRDGSQLIVSPAPNFLKEDTNSTTALDYRMDQLRQPDISKVIPLIDNRSKSSISKPKPFKIPPFKKPGSNLDHYNDDLNFMSKRKSSLRQPSKI